MTEATKRPEEWTASYYFVSIDVSVPIDSAWRLLLDYRAWNPSFEGADVAVVAGTSGEVGERVLISKPNEVMDGEVVPPFFAETVALDHQRHHVVWYVYPVTGELFRNFVDFRLVNADGLCRFEISYCEQNGLTGDQLLAHRREYETSLKDVALAFRKHFVAEPESRI